MSKQNERRRLSARDEIEAATVAETEAVSVLVKELPYEFVAHESSSGTTITVFQQDDIGRIEASHSQTTTSETAIYQLSQSSDDVIAEKSSSSQLESRVVSKPCALCLTLVASDTGDDSDLLKGQDILNSVCSCFSIKRTPSSDTAKELQICTRCNSLISDALDYRRTLERVKSLLDETVASLQEVLLGSCKEQLQGTQTTDCIQKAFEGNFGKFRLALLNCWNGTKLELKKHNLNPDGTVASTKRLRKEELEESTAETTSHTQYSFRAQPSGGRVLRRCITKPSYFRDMVGFDQVALKASILEEQDAGCNENAQATTKADEVQLTTDKTLLKTELSAENLENLTDIATSDKEDDVSEAELPTPKKLRQSKRRYDCTSCRQKFVSIKRLELHSSSVHGLEIRTDNLSCRFCSTDFKDALQPQELSDSNSKNFVCTLPQCGKRYNSLLSLHLHHERTCLRNPKARSSGTPKLSCSSCSKEFLTQVALNHHTKSVHEKSFKLCCEVCGLGFQAINMLKRHVMYVHSSEKRYECEVCQAKFKRSHQLLYHRRKHTGELPFKCEICARAFKQPDKLKQHMAVHSSKETPCPICSKLFASKQYVTNHIRDTHKGVRKHKPALQSRLKTAEQAEDLQTTTIEETVPPESVTVIVQSEPVIQEGPTEEIICEEFSFQRIA